MRAVLVFIIVCLYGTDLRGQVGADTVLGKVDNLTQAYKEGYMSDLQYLDSVSVILKGGFMRFYKSDNKQFLRAISPYKELVWRKPGLSSYKSQYYFLLVGNAKAHNRAGEAIYYVDKIERLKDVSVENSLLALTEKVFFLASFASYEKACEAYNAGLPSVDQYLGKLEKRQIKSFNDISIFRVLNGSGNAFAHMRDSAGLNSVIHKCEVALKYWLQNVPHDSKIGTTIRTLTKCLSFYRADMIWNDSAESAKVIAELTHILQSTQETNEAWNGRMNYNLDVIKANFYTKTSQNDSGEYYVDQLKPEDPGEADSDAVYLTYKAKLLINQGELAAANKVLERLVMLKDELNVELASETNDLLYAYTQAEDIASNLVIAEKEMREKTGLIIAVISTSIALFSILILIYLRRSRKTKAKLGELSRIADVQVAAMEEMKWQAVRDEQERLGRDLHDGMSATILAIRNKINLLAMQRESSDVEVELKEIYKDLTKVYEVVRDKSHQWFHSEDITASHFERNVDFLVKSVLPANTYATTITIDDAAVRHVSLDKRIALLRIIQEAVANVVKHTKARQLSIALYEELNVVLLCIADDGKGFQSKNGSDGIGLKSMKKRSVEIGADMTVNSNASGTEIIINIPLELDLPDAYHA